MLMEEESSLQQEAREEVYPRGPYSGGRRNKKAD
jgi:hypothetical protein